MDLEAAAKARKAKLADLKARKLGGNVQQQEVKQVPETRQTDDDEEGENASNGHATSGKRRRENGDDIDVLMRPSHLEADTAEFAKEALQAEKDRNQELDLTNLAPKKPNWDLKRDLERKLKKLDRKTQIAITDLIRKRLQKDGDVGDVVGAAGDGVNMKEQEDSDDE
ncbi:hypothetical protein SmJEL517_g03050 [Synchytrium microbalum]|uniref:Cwf18 pre-mRNA splicing factor n=1 Tax=Synchytrium microbalum TaxID=1806994 RepID=A0A507C9G9_9FUNG|nr:uncharacterized protein SmJEL517_g03050 [Synchytrium microbalum]TPX34193.1 hypothetical protein SmJEL517_g03050 [Synchytrium microbalum]